MAVYTEVGDEELATFVAEYAIGHVVACKGIAEGIENTNYLLVTDKATFILTLYERRVRIDDLPFFISLMEYLAARGVPCPTPVRGRDGEALRQLNGRPAAMVTFLGGMSPRRLTPEHCGAVGEALAGLHLAGADFPMRRRNDLSVDGWRPLLRASARHNHEVAAELVSELTEDIAHLESEWPTRLPEGVIHADLFPDNVFFHGDRLSGVIDFYFACTDFLAYDLAVCLNAWCFESDGSFNVTKARRLVGAYQSVRPLTAAEWQAFPLLAHGAAMRFLLTRLYDWLHTPRTALVTPKNPVEYLQKMRFHRRVRTLGEYGLDVERAA
jgi:homoserine kinase, Neisseria type